MNPNLKISSLNCRRTRINNITLNNLFENQDIICLAKSSHTNETFL